MRNFLYFFIFLFALNVDAQSSTVKVLDSLSSSPVSFATVYFSNNKGIITDGDGRFELINEQYDSNDSLFISSMGYKKMSLKINTKNRLYFNQMQLFVDGTIVVNNFSTTVPISISKISAYSIEPNLVLNRFTYLVLFQKLLMMLQLLRVLKYLKINMV